MKHTMHTNGGTQGAVSGKNRVWLRGQVLDVPEGEFRHLPDSDYAVETEQPPAQVKRRTRKKES